MANNPKPKRQTKIMTKLLFLIVPAVVVTIVALVAASSIITRKTMTKTAISQLDSSISNQADNIEAWLEKNLESFASIKKIIEKTVPRGMVFLKS